MDTLTVDPLILLCQPLPLLLCLMQCLTRTPLLNDNVSVSDWTYLKHGEKVGPQSVHCQG